MGWLFRLSIFLIFLGRVVSVCNSDDYCPGNWRVLRRADQTPHTCNAMSGQTKCPKPYSCVHASCGLDFCCAHEYKLQQYNKQLEIERDIREAEEEDKEDDEL